MSPSPGLLPDDAFRRLIDRAVAEVIAAGALEPFLVRFRALLGTMAADGRLPPLDADGLRALSTMLGHAIWSATPAPHNDFRPKPLPSPGRNEPCPCGSGRKFKRCCAIGPAMPPLNPAELWPGVLAALPPAGRKAALASRRVPVEGLIMAADEALDSDKPHIAVELLQPLFDDGFAGVDERFDTALTVLCDAWDELGQPRKKIALLERVRAEAPRSPMRSGACQRLATIALDGGDSPAAWVAFREAQRDDPDSPSIGLLEVQLLTYERRFDAARERARFWRLRLERMRDPELKRSIDLLSAIIEDPESALADVVIRSTGGAGGRLHAMVQSIEGRPLPSYSAAPPGDAPAPGEDPLAAIKARLRGMGVAREQIDEVARDMLEQIKAFEAGGGVDEDEDADGAGDNGDLFDSEEAASAGSPVETAFRIVTPPDLLKLEADWHAIYPIGKPFSVNPAPAGDIDPWEPGIEDRWMGFLERHPEAFDSIDILDDLACALELHPAGDPLAIGGTLQRPLVERVAGMLANLGGNPNLPWPDTDNRPALRCLFRAHLLATDRGDLEVGRRHAELLLRLNPGDNHGVRAGLMNLLLRAGENNAALDLALRFEDDMFAEIPYGRVLALVRLGRDREAVEAARAAVESLPAGGKDQAWIYREEMRDVWLGSPEAMDLIRRVRAG